jgi:hypothetical protein
MEIKGKVSFGMDVKLMEEDDTLEEIADYVLMYADPIDVVLDDSSDILESLKREATDFDSLLFDKVKALRSESTSYYYEAENLGGEEVMFWGNMIFTDESDCKHTFKLSDVYEDYSWDDSCWE